MINLIVIINKTSGMSRAVVWARRALAGAGIQSLEQLTQFSEAEINNLHGIGPNALAKLCQALQDNGLTFANEK